MTTKSNHNRGIDISSHGYTGGEELRFSFGSNWSAYLSGVNQTAIHEARNSIVKVLGVSDLSGRSFLDIGCGSGIFSLAAKSLGATVLSFDYDTESVRCAEQLKARYSPDDPAWIIRQGSILDSFFVQELGQFDVVYAWGVLHHTGNMWRAMEHAAALVRTSGTFVVAIYNDQGHCSRAWLRIKQIYNKLPNLLRIPYVCLVMAPLELRSFLFAVLQCNPSRYVRTWTHYRQFRGMSKWYDLVDWVGGLPFEVAKPEQVIFFLRDHGFTLTGLTTCAGAVGCNEFVFHRGPLSDQGMQRAR